VPIPPLEDESPRPGGVVLPRAPLPLEPDEHEGQSPVAPYGRWCPYCGADLSGVAVREEPREEAAFAAAGRRLKLGLAVGFVLLWLGVQIWDWIDDPAIVLVPGWFSALGVIVFGFLLGIEPLGWFRKRR
jgi:hypothetical protein